MTGNRKPMDIVSNTESPSNFQHLDKMTVSEIICGMNLENETVQIAVEKALPQIEKLIENIIRKMKNGGRLFYLGAGTSGRLGVMDASELPPTFGAPDNLVIALIAGGDKALRKAVENAEDDQKKAWEDLQEYKINANDSLIGIAASGTTPYVTGGLKKARENGILTGCITCNAGSPLARAAEYPVEAITGPEFITGSTRLKAGTAQKIILNMISSAIMIKLGRVEGNKMVNMQLTNNKLRSRGIKMIMEEFSIDADTARDLLMQYGSVKKVLQKLR
jgi:N-acetylmuramic acid 6-phosphate etherase